ncbi:MAG: hypothetical protein AB3X44_21620 [Leptothrix sp. (in: b-proteobacteria)]
MSVNDECIGCGRPASAISATPDNSVSHCEFVANRAAGRCVWRERQRDAGEKTDLKRQGNGSQPNALHDKLAAAYFEANQLKAELAKVQADHANISKLADQHLARLTESKSAQGVLESEVQRLAELVKSASHALKASTTSPQDGASGLASPKVGIVGFLARLVENKLQLGGASALVGALLSVAGMNAFGPDSASAPPGQGPNVQHTSTPSSQPSTARISGAEIQRRLDSALALCGAKATTRVSTTLDTVFVDDLADNAEQRDRTDTIIGAAYAGAGLPDPIIQHSTKTIRSDSHPTGNGAPTVSSASNIQQHSPDIQKLPVSGGTIVSPITSERHALDRNKPTLMGADSNHTHTPASASVGMVATTNIGLEESCKRQVSDKSFAAILQSWDVFKCMRRECCNQTLSASEECQKYNSRFPFNCQQ